jgi:phosphatidylglycerophosphate synthase
MRVSIAELRQKAQRRTSNLYDTLFTRRVSIYVTALLYPLEVSANAVSAVNGLVAVSACALIGLGTERWQVLLGIALVHVYAVLDSVDGELARLRRTFTIKGLFLEDLSAFTMINGFFLAVAWYLHRTTGSTTPVILAVAVVGFGRNAMQVARRAIWKWLESHRPVAGGKAGGGKASLLGVVRALVEEHLLHYTNIWIVLTTLIGVELFGGPRLAGYAFAFYVCAVLAKELAAIAMLAMGDELRTQATSITAHVRATPTEPE